MYSPVEGAAANELPDQVADGIKQERYDIFMQAQQVISTAKLQQRIGQTMKVLVEEQTDEGYVARSYADAPEIDGLVYIETDQALALGEFHQVEVVDTDEYDCYAILCSG